MEPKCSLLRLQQPITYPLSESDQYSSRPLSNFLKSHLNIIFQSTSGSTEWSLSLRFPHQNPALTCPFSHTSVSLITYSKRMLNFPRKYFTVFSLIRHRISSFYTDSRVYSSSCNYITMLLRFSCTCKAFNPTVNGQYCSRIEKYHN